MTISESRKLLARKKRLEKIVPKTAKIQAEIDAIEEDLYRPEGASLPPELEKRNRKR